MVDLPQGQSGQVPVKLCVLPVPGRHCGDQQCRETIRPLVRQFSQAFRSRLARVEMGLVEDQLDEKVVFTKHDT